MVIRRVGGSIACHVVTAKAAVESLLEADPDSNDVLALFISDRHTVGVLDSKFRLYCLVEVCLR